MSANLDQTLGSRLFPVTSRAVIIAHETFKSPPLAEPNEDFALLGSPAALSKRKCSIQLASSSLHFRTEDIQSACFRNVFVTGSQYDGLWQHNLNDAQQLIYRETAFWFVLIVSLRRLRTRKQAIDNLIQRLGPCAQFVLFVGGNRHFVTFRLKQTNTPPQRLHGRVGSPAANRHAFWGSVFHDAIILEEVRRPIEAFSGPSTCLEVKFEGRLMPSGMFASAAHAQTIRRYTSSVGWDFPAFHRVNVEQATFASRQIVGMLLPASLAISSNSEGV